MYLGVKLMRHGDRCSVLSSSWGRCRGSRGPSRGRNLSITVLHEKYFGLWEEVRANFKITKGERESMPQNEVNNDVPTPHQSQ